VDYNNPERSTTSAEIYDDPSEPNCRISPPHVLHLEGLRWIGYVININSVLTLSFMGQKVTHFKFTRLFWHKHLYVLVQGIG
jgi:hypothetical protein